MNKFHGWLVIDKEPSISSASVVYKVKKILKANKVGHAGTLDPLATGVLLVAIGEATKLISYAMDCSKEYLFTINFGIATSTDDLEGEIIATSFVRPTQKQIQNILSEFIGHILQAPPIYSAIHLNGKRSYELARAGLISELPKRKVFVEKLELIKFNENYSEFKIVCGKGTYVRSIARDMAIKLGTFGHVTSIRRTKIGKFLIQDAISLDKLKDLVHNQQNICEATRNCKKYIEFLLSVNIVLDDILVLKVSDLEASELFHGKLINTELNFCNDQILRAQNSEGKLIALGKYYDQKFKPIRVFNY